MPNSHLVQTSPLPIDIRLINATDIFLQDPKEPEVSPRNRGVRLSKDTEVCPRLSEDRGEKMSLSA